MPKKKKIYLETPVWIEIPLNQAFTAYGLVVQHLDYGLVMFIYDQPYTDPVKLKADYLDFVRVGDWAIDDGLWSVLDVPIDPTSMPPIPTSAWYGDAFSGPIGREDYEPSNLNDPIRTFNNANFEVVNCPSSGLHTPFSLVWNLIRTFTEIGQRPDYKSSRLPFPREHPVWKGVGDPRWEWLDDGQPFSLTTGEAELRGTVLRRSDHLAVVDFAVEIPSPLDALGLYRSVPVQGHFQTCVKLIDEVFFSVGPLGESAICPPPIPERFEFVSASYSYGGRHEYFLHELGRDTLEEKTLPLRISFEDAADYYPDRSWTLLGAVQWILRKTKPEAARRLFSRN